MEQLAAWEEPSARESIRARGLFLRVARRAASFVPFALAAAAGVALAACGEGDPIPETPEETRVGPAIRVSAFDFGSESLILGEIYAQQLEAHGFAVDRSRLEPGEPREVLKPALESGEVDLVAEYVGTLLRFLGGEPTSDGDENQQAAAELFAESGVTVLPASPEAENVNALVTTQGLSEELGLTEVSDLADHANDLTLGGPPECPDREFCLIGLREVYGIEFGEFVPLGFDERSAALEGGGIDVAVLFSTDAVIFTNEWVVLEDDRGLQPAEHIAPVIRTALLEEYGEELEDALNAVTEKLTTESLAEMNAEFQVDGHTAPEIARVWLVENDLVEVPAEGN